MAESDPLTLGARPLRLLELRRVYEAPIAVTSAAQALSAVRDAHGKLTFDVARELVVNREP